MGALNKRLALLVFMTLALAACGRPHAVSSADLRTALQDYYDRHPVCVSLAIALPADLDAHGIEPMRPQLQALAKVGLLTAVAASKLNASEAEQAAVHILYRIAPGAEKSVQKSHDSFMGGTDLCFAERMVTKVESFSPPEKVMDQTVSQVRYDFVLSNIAPWARNEAIAQAFPPIKAALSQRSGQETETMVLTRQGWQVERAAQ